MDDRERIARAIAQAHGTNPDTQVVPFPLMKTPEGYALLAREWGRPYWTTKLAEADAVLAELSERPLGWKPPEEPKSEEPTEPELEGFQNGGTSDPVGLDAGALTSADWEPEPKEEKTWAERNGLR